MTPVLRTGPNLMQRGQIWLDKFILYYPDLRDWRVRARQLVKTTKLAFCRAYHKHKLTFHGARSRITATILCRRVHKRVRAVGGTAEAGARDGFGGARSRFFENQYLICLNAEKPIYDLTKIRLHNCFECGRMPSVGIDFLELHAPAVAARLPSLLHLWSAGKLSDPEISLCYILVHLQVWSPRTWFGGSVPGAAVPSHPSPPLRDLPPDALMFGPKTIAAISRVGPPTLLTLTSCRLRGVPQAALDTLREWMLGACRLQLMRTVPTAVEVLHMQCDRTRVVSMMADASDLRVLHEGHDPLDFLVHDLVHANRMLGRGAEHLHMHVGALRLLRRTLESGALAGWLAADAEFRATFEYGISDMNTHCLHTLQHFKHASIAAFLRAHGLPATARMPPELEREYYDMFRGMVRVWWPTAGVADPAGDDVTADPEREVVLAALMALCERDLSEVEHAALLDFCRREGER